MSEISPTRISSTLADNSRTVINGIARDLTAIKFSEIHKHILRGEYYLIPGEDLTNSQKPFLYSLAGLVACGHFGLSHDPDTGTYLFVRTRMGGIISNAFISTGIHKVPEDVIADAKLYLTDGMV